MGDAHRPGNSTSPEADEQIACGSRPGAERIDRASAASLPSLAGSNVSPTFKIACALALLWYFSSHFFPIHVEIAGKDIPVNAAAGSYLIPLFGIYRYRTETDPYQKKRIVWIVGLYLLLWVIIPALLGFREVVPQLDGRERVFPAIHYVESLGFLLFFIPILLLGRRADCGWCCPCVASRETFAAAFRKATLKGDAWWWLRYLKWINVAAVLLFLAALSVSPHTAYSTYGIPFYAYLLGIYYLSFLFIPWSGSRNFCRWGVRGAGYGGFSDMSDFTGCGPIPSAAPGADCARKSATWGFHCAATSRKEGWFAPPSAWGAAAALPFAPPEP